MIIKWLINNPVIVGLITILLMYSDWLLTIVQETERKDYYYKHYQSYPINTIEGNLILRDAVTKKKWINQKHLIIAILIGIGVPFVIMKFPQEICEIFLGYVWGIFFIVDTQHLSNIIGYKVSRRGLHGMLKIHQRTAYLIQSSRYLSTTIFLIIISVLSQSHIIYGITVAGVTSTLRQFLWLKKVPSISSEDLPPDEDLK